MYVELLKHMYVQKERNERVMKLNKSLYKVRDATRTWSKLLYNNFRNLGTEKLRRAPCVLVN